METKDLIKDLNKILGITHVLPFGDVVAIDFDERKFLGNFTEETMLHEIKKAVYKNGFNMITTKRTSRKKFIILIPLRNGN